MRYIKVPATVIVEFPGDSATPKEYPFYDFIVDCINTSPLIGQGYENPRNGDKIKKLVIGLKPDDALKLEEDEWRNLKEFLRTCHINPIFNLAALPYHDVVLSAGQEVLGK